MYAGDEFYDDEVTSGPVRTEPTLPPFAVGDAIRYTGASSFSYGDHPMVEPGDIGVVIENRYGQPGRPDLGEQFASALDGYSLVLIKGNRMAIDTSSTDRYVRVPPVSHGLTSRSVVDSDLAGPGADSRDEGRRPTEAPDPGRSGQPRGRGFTDRARRADGNVHPPLEPVGSPIA